MKAQKTSATGNKSGFRVGGEARETYKSRDLCKVNPLREQFAPTPAQAVNQHKRMAGC